MEIRITGKGVMCSHEFMVKDWVKNQITYNCFWKCVHHANDYQSSQFTDTPYKVGICVHHTKNYQSSLLTLHIRLVHPFISQTITRVVTDTPFYADTYIHHMKSYHGSLLTLIKHKILYSDGQRGALEKKVIQI